MRDKFTFFGVYFLLLVSLLVNLEKRVITWDEGHRDYVIGRDAVVTI